MWSHLLLETIGRVLNHSCHTLKHNQFFWNMYMYITSTNIIYILFKMHRLVDKCFDFKHFTSPAQVWWSPFHCTSYYFLHLSQSPSVSQTQPRCNKALTPGSSLKIKTMLTSKHPPRMTHTTYIFLPFYVHVYAIKPIIGSTQIHCICILNTVENLKKNIHVQVVNNDWIPWMETRTCNMLELEVHISLP